MGLKKKDKFEGQLNAMELKIFSYYYPFYDTKPGESWRRGCVSEWELLKKAAPIFEGHKIRRPVGYHACPAYYDASIPYIIREQVALAKRYCIDGFIFNSYIDVGYKWYLDLPLRNFMAIPEKESIQFVINWSFKLPRRWFPQRYQDDNDDRWRKQPFDIDYFVSLTKMLAKEYFCHPSYFYIDGRPVLYLYELTSIFRYHNHSFNLLIKAIKAANETAREFGYPGIYYVGVFSHFDPAIVQLADSFVDAATGYAFLPNFSTLPLIQSYSSLVEQRVNDWSLFANTLTVPWFPPIVAGWDASSRGESGITAEIEGSVSWPPYPWFPVVTDTTPRAFEEWLYRGIDFLKKQGRTPTLINVTSFNEWTEGNAIEPNDQEGDAFLRVIRDFAKAVKSLPE